MPKLSDRMKNYESVTDQILTPNLPIIIRTDGRAFHSWTRGLERPYDASLNSILDEVAKYLLEQTNAITSYVQSDEISLVLWNYGDSESQIFFNGRVNKLNSVIASMATAKFNSLASIIFPDKPIGLFDCRSFCVSTPEEAVNYLIWREADCMRNSVSMAAQSFYSPKQLHKKNSSEMQELIFQAGTNYNDYPSRFKRGAYFKRKLIERKFTNEELADLPAEHEAFKNPNLLIKRHVVKQLELPPLTKVKNRVDVIFYDKESILHE